MVWEELGHRSKDFQKAKREKKDKDIRISRRIEGTYNKTREKNRKYTECQEEKKKRRAGMMSIYEMENKTRTCKYWQAREKQKCKVARKKHVTEECEKTGEIGRKFYKMTKLFLHI